MRNFLFLLKILPAGSDLLASSPTASHLCLFFAIPSSLPSLSLRQGRRFDTKHKQTLQADNRRSKDLNFIILN
jgi:hypothetical protein